MDESNADGIVVDDREPSYIVGKDLAVVQIPDVVAADAFVAVADDIPSRHFVQKANLVWNLILMELIFV